MPAERQADVQDTPPAPAGGVSWRELYVTIAAVVAFALALIWGLTGAGYFWPRWAWFGLGVPIALWLAVHRARRGRERGPRRFAVVAALAATLSLMLILIWWFGHPGYFWPAWPIGALASVTAIVGVFVYLPQLIFGPRETELSERVKELTRTRRGALDVQAAELRRIERDLHDGAQARLVSLSMQLGRAEERLDDQPEIAELVREARNEAANAISELRDLARGIAPPILADRGLAAAIDALGRRSPMPVMVEGFLERRPTPVVENAAYFVVAESLTNVAKHADGAAARVALRQTGELLLIEVADGGPGGADPNGSGLIGLRHRVEALDGTLEVTSTAGEGTTIRASLPCE